MGVELQNKHTETDLMDFPLQRRVREDLRLRQIKEVTGKRFCGVLSFINNELKSRLGKDLLQVDAADFYELFPAVLSTGELSRERYLELLRPLSYYYHQFLGQTMELPRWKSVAVAQIDTARSGARLLLYLSKKQGVELARVVTLRCQQIDRHRYSVLLPENGRIRQIFFPDWLRQDLDFWIGRRRGMEYFFPSLLDPGKSMTVDLARRWMNRLRKNE